MNYVFMKDEIESKEPEYAKMVSGFTDNFDSQMPGKWTLEETLEMGVYAWNIANLKNTLATNEYRSIIKDHKQSKLLHKMVEYKDQHFADFPNIIIEYEISDNKLTIKSQNRKDSFESLLQKMITKNPLK